MQSKPSSCYQHGVSPIRRAKRRVVKVYGPVDTKRQDRREAQGWKPNQPHARPSTSIETSVKPVLP